MSASAPGRGAEGPAERHHASKGPLRLTDLGGLDARLAIADHLPKEIGQSFAPPFLRHLIPAGKLGKRSGEAVPKR